MFHGVRPCGGRREGHKASDQRPLVKFVASHRTVGGSTPAADGGRWRGTLTGAVGAAGDGFAVLFSGGLALRLRRERCGGVLGGWFARFSPLPLGSVVPIILTQPGAPAG